MRRRRPGAAAGGYAMALALLAVSVGYLYRRLTVLDLRLRRAEATPRPRPWTVVAMQQRYGPRGAFFGIDYVSPTGGLARWEREIPAGAEVDPETVLRCWSEARVGDPLPECAQGSGYPDPHPLLV